MSFSATTFKGNLAKAGGGARPSLYKVKISSSATGIPTVTGTEGILVKAAALPASTIAPLAVNYAGRAYKWSGFRTYDNWTVTVMNDEDFVARNKMMHCMRYLSGQLDGTRDGTFGDPSNDGTWFDGQAFVQQVSVGGGTVGPEYKLLNLWPTELGEIAVDWSSDAMQEYTIGFAYDYWSQGTGTTTQSSTAAPPNY